MPSPETAPPPRDDLGPREDVSGETRADIAALRRILERMAEGLARIARGEALQAGDEALLGARQSVIDGGDKLASAMVRLVALERQAREPAGEDQNEIGTVKRVIVRPGDTDPGGVPPAADAEAL